MSQHLADGIILCLGADGHVEVENRRSGDCAIVRNEATVDMHFGYESMLTERSLDDCGPCVDIAVLTNVVEGQAGVAAGSHTPVIAVAAPGSTQFRRRDLLPAVSTGEPAHRAAGPVRETAPVVLLI